MAVEGVRLCGGFYKLYISSSWVRIGLQTEIQLPRLPASNLFWWGCDPACDGVKTKSTPSLTITVY